MNSISSTSVSTILGRLSSVQGAALFDLDGVILDTEPQYTLFWEQQFDEFFEGRRQLAQTIKGQTLTQMFDQYFSGERLALRPVITARLDDYEQHMHYPYIAGVEDFIVALRRRGVKTAVVTSSNSEKMKNVFAAHPELTSWFDAILTAEDFDHSKPHPDCYLKAAALLGCKVDDCVVFEDSFNGLRAGREAGMTVVGLATTNSEADIAPLADVVMETFARAAVTAKTEMTLLEAIRRRHSVRRYIDRPLPAALVAVLQAKVEKVNAAAGLHIQLVTDEPRAFRGVFAYGKFSGVSNYFVMIGPKGKGLDDKIGYYGEQLVLLAQQLGLNTCWAGLSYTKIADTYTLAAGEKVACYIALGYGATQGVERKSKTVEQVSNASEAPEWFRRGVEAALLAPTAINQQKFRFEYLGDNRVAAHRLLSMVGYTEMDLGIARLHFEIGAERGVDFE